MRYTKFFGEINKENGLQQISRYQLARIMNIAFLEGKVLGVQATAKTFKENINSRGTELLNFQIRKRITELTGNKDPKSLMEEICYLSEKEQ